MDTPTPPRMTSDVKSNRPIPLLHPAALQVALGYALAALAWIALSDYVLDLLAPPRAMGALQSLKGGIFVLLTSLLLYRLVYRHLPGRNEAQTWPRQRLWRPILFYLAFATALSALAFNIYRAAEQGIDEAVARDLDAIAQLKTDQIARWLNERQSDARAIGLNPLFITAIEDWQHTPADAKARARLNGALRAYRNALGYRELHLLDSTGQRVLFTTAATAPTAAELAVETRGLTQNQPTLTDFHYRGQDSQRHIALALSFPILDSEERPLAILYLEIAPERELYPTLLQWPTPSRSAETLLVSQDGQQIVYLSDTRLAPDMALRLRTSVDDDRLLAAQLIRSATKPLRALDYRHVPVIGVGRNIPGTSWLLITKIDSDEAFSRLTLVGKLTALILAALLLGTAFAGILYWRGLMARQRADQEQHRLQQEALREHYALLAKYANDIIYLADAQGRLVEGNDRALAAYGRTREEFLTLTLPQLRADSTRAELPALLERLWREHHLIYETVHQHRDGTPFPVEVSTRALNIEGQRFLHAVVRDISERKAAEARIDFLAGHDALTGLPNRSLLADRAHLVLDLAHRSASPVALIYLDLDRFQAINDSLGHNLGDQLLQEVARRLQSQIRAADTLARLGGDEFALLLPDTGADGAAHIAGKLQQALATPIALDGHTLRISVSQGISLYPLDAETYSDLVRNADAALLAAKNAGRNGYRFYEAAMNARIADQLALEMDLREALENNALHLHFQPQFTLNEARLVGAEVLLRWNHPVHGPISPARFIPVAEETGLILPLGAWVLRQACQQWRIWHEAGLNPPPLAVNLSAAQFQASGLPEEVAAVLAETGMPATSLELELTETIVAEDAERAETTMHRLADLGIHLSIDDFGTGYSSLAYLRRFPLHKLKIDQSFVRELANAGGSDVIVIAIIQLGKALGLTVIAEGVETPAQRDFLRQQGCDEVQGYLFGRPIPADQFTALLGTPAPAPAANRLSS